MIGTRWYSPKILHPSHSPESSSSPIKGPLTLQGSLIPAHFLMDGSSGFDDSSTTTASPPRATPLQRMGSGASSVTDPPAGPGPDLGGEAESGRKLPSSQYKGVVPQPNGRWGAQIYEKHQRVWLGTFNLERDAARAYDVAAQRFRGRDAATNFPPLAAADGPDAARELAFLFSRSKAEIVDMLRKHTYLDELRHSAPATTPSGDPLRRSSPARPAREQLFEKAVTPSDVGKLNRLVIPKQHAEKHFPLPLPAAAEGGGAAAAKGLLLNFEDGGGKVWRFRYSYWNSSQSYVLTKGWSRFVKEMGLKAGDTVGFYRSKGADRQLYIDYRSRDAAGAGAMVRLFGVNIAKASISAVAAGGMGENRKRSLGEVEEAAASVAALPPWIKKQCVVGF
uniref:AP2/ERF and B3 domain-containing protein n=1 Tax=Apostasia odorata TaxID=280455 RepID=A0A1S6YG06_9ASPA|nr:hypothetical protein [Apostasia odorata]